ncbi:MAG: formimidoylglutamase [Phycisphaera sp.]|nr:MAG: formimidoylglutamase [Phycisphaera sp.]
MEVPYATPPQTPIELHEGRFSERVQPIDAYQPKPFYRKPFAILGMPDDTGVKLNNGRPGAKEGPSAIRRVLSTMGVKKPSFGLWPKVYDAGDVLPAGDDLDETHRRVSKASAALVRAGFFPIGLGGGHDLTFAFVRGVINGLASDDAPREGIYLDAHLDVRETKGSGMPFRRLVEDCGIESLTIAGYERKVNSDEHMKWFMEHRGGVLFLDDPVVDETDDEEDEPRLPYFASLDLDAIDVSQAPGVSATNPCGVLAQTARRWIRDNLRSPSLRCFDIMELSPPHDDQDRTAQLAAYLFLEALDVIDPRNQ